jgi:hypothetical protein
MLNFLNGVVNGSLGFEIGTSERTDEICYFLRRIQGMLVFRVLFIWIVDITAGTEGLVNFLIKFVFLKHHLNKVRILVRDPFGSLSVIPVTVRVVPIGDGGEILAVLIEFFLFLEFVFGFEQFSFDLRVYVLDEKFLKCLGKEDLIDLFMGINFRFGKSLHF